MKAEKYAVEDIESLLKVLNGEFRLPDIKDSYRMIMKVYDTDESIHEYARHILSQLDEKSTESPIIGLILSAYINRENDPIYSLKTKTPIPFLGYRFGENGVSELNIEGNIGDFPGALMQRGKISVKGTAGHYPGYGMKSGTIEASFGTILSRIRSRTGIESLRSYRMKKTPDSLTLKASSGEMEINYNSKGTYMGTTTTSKTVKYKDSRSRRY